MASAADTRRAPWCSFRQQTWPLSSVTTMVPSSRNACGTSAALACHAAPATATWPRPARTATPCRTSAAALRLVAGTRKIRRAPQGTASRGPPCRRPPRGAACGPLTRTGSGRRPAPSPPGPPRVPLQRGQRRPVAGQRRSVWSSDHDGIRPSLRPVAPTTPAV